MRRRNRIPAGLTLRASLVTAAILLATSAALAQPALHPDYQPVVPGLDYARIQMKNWDNGEPWSIHIARLDRSQQDLQVVSTLARKASFGLASISAQAKSIPQTTGLPVVAINTDFCILKRDPYQGTPRGLQIMQGQFISPPFTHSFWVNEDGGMFLGDVAPKLSATLPGGKTFPIGFNHRCGADKVVLFTSMIGKSTRATNYLELVLEDPLHRPLSWRAGQGYSLRVRSVNPSGNTPLSRATAVLSFGKATADKVGKPRPGDEVTLNLATEPELGKVVTGMGCIFPLVHGGEVLKAFAGSRYLLSKHPRTAIGLNSHSFYMVVVDGRQKGLSLGMYPKELARFMVLLGCTEAVNLDGGGSSTFWLQGHVRNSPCGGKERSLANGLAIVQRPAR